MSMAEKCLRCGRRYLSVWAASDSLWKLVVGETHAGLYCLPCFEAMCAAAGVVPHWTCATADEIEDECQEREALRGKNARLQAIVDKLPTTADGVPVWPGMPVYVNWADADREQQRVFYVHPVEHPGDTGALFHDDVVVPLEIAYSTPEAARKAQEEGK